MKTFEKNLKKFIRESILLNENSPAAALNQLNDKLSNIKSENIKEIETLKFLDKTALFLSIAIMSGIESYIDDSQGKRTIPLPLSDEATTTPRQKKELEIPGRLLFRFNKEKLGKIDNIVKRFLLLHKAALSGYNKLDKKIGRDNKGPDSAVIAVIEDCSQNETINALFLNEIISAYIRTKSLGLNTSKLKNIKTILDKIQKEHDDDDKSSPIGYDDATEEKIKEFKELAEGISKVFLKQCKEIMGISQEEEKESE